MIVKGLRIFDISLNYIESDGKPHFYEPIDISHILVVELFGKKYINYYGVVRELTQLGCTPYSYFLDSTLPEKMAERMEKVREPYLRSKGVRWIDGSMQYA